MKFVVLGAQKGLGYHLVKQLLTNGHKVAAGVLKDEGLEDLKIKHSNKFMVFECDVTKESQILSSVKKCKTFLGKIDAMCYVAGIIRDDDRNVLLHESNTDDMRATFEVNFFGAYIAAREFYKIAKIGASIYLITSESCYTKSVGTWVPCYAISKTAQTKLVGMFNAAVNDISFYAIHPGRMNTDMGRTTAQIEPEESANGIADIMTGRTEVSRESWYIDYKGNAI